MPAFSSASLIVLAGLATAYLAATFVQQRAHSPWSRWRTAGFMVGLLLLSIAVAPPVVEWAHHDLRGHMVQHLLIGMLAPLALVLAAPFTLLLRTLTVPAARRVTAALRSRPFRVITHPVTALLLNTGGMYVLYVTPLYAAALHSPLLHSALHLHALAAGYLFCWAVLAGPDPAPHPPGMRLRLLVLLFAIAAHATLSKLLYVHRWPPGTSHSVEEIQAAAQLMYYGGDLAEMMLAVALFALWYRTPASRRHQFLPSLSPS